MTKECAFFTLPSPIIKEVGGSLDQLRGWMWVTSELMGKLQGDLEGLDDLTRAMRERPTTISPDAVKGRMQGLHALAEAIDTRMEQALELLDAIIDKECDETAKAA